MKTKNKGFTLVELLAVIVILAIILAIAVPTISSLINNARKSSFENGTKMVLKSMKNDYDGKMATSSTFADTFILYENNVKTVFPSSNNLDFTISATDGGIVRHSDGTVTLALYDGYSCVTKTRNASELVTIVTDKATCISNIYYKQTTAPFANLITNGDFSSGGSGWFSQYSDLTVTNGIAQITHNGVVGTIRLVQNNILNLTDKYYFKEYVRTDYFGNFASMNIRYTGSFPLLTSNAWSYRSMIGKSINTALSLEFSMPTFITGVSNVQIDDVIVVNLTTTYGSGNEPSLSQMDDNVNKVWIDTSMDMSPKRLTGGGWVNF